MNGAVGRKKPSYYDLHASTIPKPWLQHKDHKRATWELFVDLRLVFFGCHLRRADAMFQMYNRRQVIGRGFPSARWRFPLVDVDVERQCVVLRGRHGYVFRTHLIIINSNYDVTINNICNIEDGIIYTVFTHRRNIAVDAIFDSSIRVCRCAQHTEGRLPLGRSLDADVNNIADD